VRSGGSSDWIPAIGGGLGSAAVALVAGWVAFRRRQDGAEADDPTASEVEEDRAIAAILAEIERRRAALSARSRAQGSCTTLIHNSAEGTDAMSDATMPDPTMTATTASVPGEAPDEGPSTYAELGRRVTRVLEHAEEVAREIRSDAAQEAAQTKAAAEEAAVARVRDSELESDQIRKDAQEYADGVRQTGDTYASRVRREAEEESRNMLSQANSEARAIRETAEEMSRRIELAAKQRKQELESELETLETRLERVLKGLRAMVAHGEHASAQPESDRIDEPLLRALDVGGRSSPK